MYKKTFQKAVKMAKDAGYDDAKILGKWKSCEVVDPIYNDDIVRYTGFPQFILLENGLLRWTNDWEESRAIMGHFYK